MPHIIVKPSTKNQHAAENPDQNIRLLSRAEAGACDIGGNGGGGDPGGRETRRNRARHEERLLLCAIAESPFWLRCRLSLNHTMNAVSSAVTPSNPAARRPPGPKPANPLFGVLAEFRKDPPAFLLRNAREYGDLVYLPRLARQHAFLVNRPEWIRDILVTHQSNFVKSRMLERAKRLLGEGLLTSEGEFHTPPAQAGAAGVSSRSHGVLWRRNGGVRGARAGAMETRRTN